MTATKARRFKIGDWIVHYYHGVGEVVDIVDKILDGDQRTLFKVSTPKIDYWLPVDKSDAEHITPIRSKVDFEQALKIISNRPTPMTETSNRMKRMIYERWLDGSLPARAALLRDLHGRNHLKELSYDEKETFHKVENFFIDEWIIVNPALSRAEARQKLNEALEKSVEKEELEPAKL